MASRGLKRLDTAALYEYAVRTLARRSLTVAELRGRLERRAAKPADVGQVISRLIEVGYLDDRRLAESHALFRRDYEGFGPQRVLRELRRRGVADKLASQAVKETYRGADELELVRQYLRRKLGRSTGGLRLEDRKQVAALFRALFRAGFSSAKIVAGLREISSDSDWLETFAEHLQTAQDDEVFD